MVGGLKKRNDVNRVENWLALKEIFDLKRMDHFVMIIGITSWSFPSLEPCDAFETGILPSEFSTRACFLFGPRPSSHSESDMGSKIDF